MGVDNRKGSLAKGKDAHPVIFDENINVSMTMVEGRIVYKKVNHGTVRRCGFTEFFHGVTQSIKTVQLCADLRDTQWL